MSKSSLGMNGSYSFDLDTVKSIVSEDRMGNYALGYVDIFNEKIVKP